MVGLVVGLEFSDGWRLWDLDRRGGEMGVFMRPPEPNPDAAHSRRGLGYHPKHDIVMSSRPKSTIKRKVIEITCMRVGLGVILRLSERKRPAQPI